VGWDSHSGSRIDPWLSSFLFTLKNPYNFPARRFALKVERMTDAILCDSRYGPHFHDICVSDNCAKAHSHIGLGKCYANSTNLEGYTVFTFVAFHSEGDRSLQDHKLNQPSASDSPTAEIAIRAKLERSYGHFLKETDHMLRNVICKQ
jgi:hypothetical protein